jgi:hypothetical protein
MMSDVGWGASLDMVNCALHMLYHLNHHSEDCLRNIGRLEILLGTLGAPPSPLYGIGRERGYQINFLRVFLLRTKT